MGKDLPAAKRRRLAGVPSPYPYPMTPAIQYASASFHPHRPFIWRAYETLGRAAPSVICASTETAKIWPRDLRLRLKRARFSKGCGADLRKRV